MKALKNIKIIIARSLARRGKFTKAEKVVTSLLQQAPRSPILKTWHADLALFSGNFVLAKRRYALARKAIADHPALKAFRLIIDTQQ